MKRYILPIAFLLGILIMSQACYNDVEEDLYPEGPKKMDTVKGKGSDTSRADGISFKDFVKPLIETNCATPGCHNASAAGGVTFLNHSGIAGKAARIDDRTVVNGTMPPGGALPQADRDKLKKWIDDGAKDN